jgi:hypothetical protein
VCAGPLALCHTTTTPHPIPSCMSVTSNIQDSPHLLVSCLVLLTPPQILCCHVLPEADPEDFPHYLKISTSRHLYHHPNTNTILTRCTTEPESISNANKHFLPTVQHRIHLPSVHSHHNSVLHRIPFHPTQHYILPSCTCTQYCVAC